MNKNEMIKFAEAFLEAWTSQDVELLLSFYTEDVEYRDPNVKGVIHGAEVFGKYLKKLFEPWIMSWTIRELYPLEAEDGFALLWRGTFKKASGDKTLEADGMDLVLLENGRIKRNDVYFDRTFLAQF